MHSNDLWVFGYGSLMWHPDFPHDEVSVATLSGYARRFSMRSIHHRGTPDHPGLVLALDAESGAQCTGLAFRVTKDAHDDTMAGLRERELVSYAYQEMTLPLRLADGRQITAVSYVIDPDHVQYSGAMALEEQAQIIATAHGGKGPNRDYLWNTHEHLGELGIKDADIDWLTERVRVLCAETN